MRFRKHVKLEKGQLQLDITPLIDVVLLLLIFFMLTSTFVLQPGIKVNLPKAATSEVLQKENLVIVVTKEDLIYLDDRTITTEQLKSELKKASTDKRPLLIRADRGSSLGKVVELWDLCREVGISQISIATTQE